MDQQIHLQDNTALDQHLLRCLMESSSALIYFKDTNGVYRRCNKRAEELIGLTEAEQIGKTDFDFFDQNKAAAIQAVDQQVLASGQEHRFEEWVTFPGGETFLFESRKTPVFGHHHEVIGILGISHDITERRKIEDTLRESEYFFKESQRSASLGSYKADLTTDHWESSEILDDIFGLDEHYNRSIQGWLDLVHPEDRGMMERYLNLEVIGRGKPFAREYRIIRQNDGEIRWVKGLGAVKTTVDGHGLILTGTIQDITAQKQREFEQENLQAQLQQAQKLESLGRLAGGVAHDLNNYLVPIIGLTELAIRKITPIATDVVPLLQQIQKSGEKAEHLVSQILDFSRRQKLNKLPINPNLVIANLEPLLQPMLEAKINLVLNLEDHLPNILADQGKFEQVIVNLVINARDAMPDGGQLVIRTFRTDHLRQDGAKADLETFNQDQVCIQVIDNGCGINKEIQDKIFEPFYSTKSRGKGTGLGLSTILGIIEQHEGTIKVDSMEGQGSTFTACFQAIPNRTSPASVAPAVCPINLSGSETILVVDDDDGVLMSVSESLRSAGYQVLEALNGAAAMELYLSSIDPIDLVLTDIIMPQIDGRKLFNKLTSIAKDLPVIYMSGYSTSFFAKGEKALDSRASFLKKPFTTHELLICIRSVLDKREDAGN
jgi:PAS domain S-box-containing protein